MENLVKESRTSLGMSMDQLGRLMGVSATSVASLERNEARGTAKIRTIKQALEAMGKALSFELSEIEPSSPIAQARTRARGIANDVADTMALEGQTLPPDVVERIYKNVLKKEMDRL